MRDGKILMWGEFPPNTHTGISVSNELVYNVLSAEDFDIIKIEEYTWSKGKLVKFIKLFKNYIQIFKIILTNKIRLFYFNLPLSKFGLFKVLLAMLLVKLFIRRTILIGHLHRGDFKLFIDRNSLNKFIARFIFVFLDNLIVLSDKYQKEVRAFSKRINVNVLHNTSGFESEGSTNEKEYKRNYVCISNYIRSKGIKELVECFGSIELRDMKLDIYGHKYDTDFYEEIKKIVSENVKLHLGLQKEEVVEILKKYDCLIIPSWNEGQPLIILEAMSLGIPVIATNVGDIPDMIGEIKLLFEPKNTKDMSDAILRFDKTDNKKEISQFLVDRYNKNYSNREYKKRLTEIFKSE